MRGARWSILLAVAVALVTGILLSVGPARAENDPAARSSSFFRCDSRHASLQEFARSDASIDVYNGVTWLAGAGALSMGTDPSRRWTRENDFDAGIRDGLRIDSAQSRQDADSISDFAMALNVALLPAAAIGTRFARTHDCVEAWEMFGDVFEAVSLALFVSEAVKVASGRERPFGERCATSPPSDANCRDGDRNLSFVSGHATLAAAGAGVSCRFALERRAFGTSSAARMAPCALGIAGALVSGTLRVASDRHWGTDVLVGFGVGALIGSFDTWGPLEWLRVEKRDGNGKLEASGFVLPFAQDGRFGAQWTMAY